MIPIPALAVALAPLQSDPLAAAEVALVGVDFVSALLGVLISYIAYRGYRRSGNRAMLFVAAGFVLIMAVPWASFLGGLAVGSSGLPGLVLGGVSEVSQLLGTLSILYAIRMETETGP